MHPLLPLPKLKKYDPKPAKRRKFGPPSPGYQAQSKKLDAKFQRIFTALNNENISISGNNDWLQPEKILVLETKNNVTADLKNIISKVDGMRWLLDYIDDAGQEDDDFHKTYTSTKTGITTKTNIPRSYLYLTMTDSQGLVELKRMWDKFKKGESQEHGFGVFKDIFEYLVDIRFWNEKDRLRDTGLEEKLTDSLEDGEDEINVEIELWYDSKSENRSIKEQFIREKIFDLGGNFLTSAQIPAINYHSVLASIPTQAVQEFLEATNETGIIHIDSIMFIRPQSEFNFQKPEISNESEDSDSTQIQVLEQLPIYDPDEIEIAILDGVPLTKHEALDKNIILHDPDDHEDTYQADERLHCTSMASIIINGDISKKGERLHKRILCRPILISDEVGEEATPNDKLWIDLVHRAVVSFFDYHEGQDPIAPNVKIINFSVGDKFRLFDSLMSPMAKLIDWLSNKYKVLFIISSGNHDDEVVLELGIDEFRQLSKPDQTKLFVDALHKKGANRRLLSPAESINSITVGSYHHDYSEPVENLPSNHIDPLDENTFPSPFNPCAMGYKKSIKPEILMPGGVVNYEFNDLYDEGQITLKSLRFDTKRPGIKSATPGAMSRLNEYCYTFGTSNATAMATRQAAKLLDSIKQMRATERYDLSHASDALIIKALLVHGADLGSIGTSVFEFKNDKKRNLARFTGHGIVNEKRIKSCLNNEATLITTGKIGINQSVQCDVPFPDCLMGRVVRKRVIVTLAWFTPINVNHRHYRGVQLRFESGKQIQDDLKILREMDHNQVRHGTVHHEVFTSDKATNIDKDFDTFPIKIRAKNDAANLDNGTEISYCMIVTLDTPDNDLPIYSEVSSRLSLKDGARRGNV